MKKIKVTIKQNSSIEYPIIIGKNISLKKSGLIEDKKYSKILCLFDEQVNLEKVKQAINEANAVYLALKAHDKHKTLEQVSKIWKTLYQNNFDRHALIINVGGGVVCDLGGFAASTYMRGIPFIQVPTTLLAQVDASIGGKTGINFLSGKNIIGTFQQPIGVAIDVSYLNTLPERELRSGFAEIIKHGIISGEKHFKQFTKKKIEQCSNEELMYIIEQSCLIKKSIVEEDSNEKSRRKVLNLGHTIGHAVESLSHKTKSPLLHGEAVSIGLITEAKISEKMNLLSRKELEEIEKMLTENMLPINYSGINIQEIKNLIKKDKKNNANVVNWTLIKNIGNIIIDQHVPEEIVTQAIREVII